MMDFDAEVSQLIGEPLDETGHRRLVQAQALADQRVLPQRRYLSGEGPHQATAGQMAAEQ